MKISVALCTFNGAKYIQRQMESIAGQSRLPDELVICDDASTDDTRSIIEGFEKKAAFLVRVVRNETNIGLYRNFERAIQMCEGDIIALADQDDVWMPDKLETIEERFSSYPDTGLLFSNAKLADEHLKPLRFQLWDLTFAPRDRRKFENGDELDVLLKHNVVTGATMAFRSKFRSVFLPFPDMTDLIHDGWIALSIALWSRIRFIDRPLIVYRQHLKQQLGAGMSRWSMPINERHEIIIGNRVNALQRLSELEGFFLTRPETQAESTKMRVSPERLSEKIQKSYVYIEGSIKHYKARAALPQTRILRIFPVLLELCRLRYHKFSRGFLSAIVDVYKY